MKVARRARFWFAAWLASLAFWVVLTDSLQTPELAAGVVVGALAATGFEVVRRERLARQAIRPALAKRVWRVLLGALVDVGRLTRAALAQAVERRPVRGRVIGIPFPHTGDDPDSRARRAVAVALGSVAPNTIVIGVDEEAEMLLVHQLEPTRDPSDLDPLGLR
jgi:multisubunit Na+/H+ antiporter MnhE subunit